jgi:hypothetical protein
MIVKFFTHGTGGSGGVFNYLLKDNEQEDGLRRDAEVLRGDIDNQALLIDSLDFKQKYTSGCLSFTESADQVTQAQKEQLMNGFEETIRAGLGVDRVAVSWIEHRDKGRLELNFVYANVDLEHGRAFQPYVHSVDKRRVNAWKDMQNIEHGFSDPNDPANKRLMGQRDNLPRDVKEARQGITDALTALVAEGVITSRADVVQSLTNAGFEIARQTDKAISIKNPDPESKRNIRLTGGLYERDFSFSREVQNTVETASNEYRAGATERYNAAKQLYDSEIERKRDYHQSRHDKPRREQRAVTADIKQASTRYSYSPYDIYRESPSPYSPRFKQTRKRESDNDSELRTAHYTADRAKRERNSSNAQIRSQNMGMVGFRDSISNIDTRLIDRSADSQKVLETDLYSAADQLRTAKLRAEVTHGQETARAGAESVRRSTRDNTTPIADARRPRTMDTAAATQERPRYSTIDSIIDQASTSANTASKGLAELARAVTDQNQRTDKRTSWLGESSQSLRRDNETLNNRINNTQQCTDSTNTTYADVSEYDSTARQSKQRDERIRDDIRQSKEITDYNQDYAGRNKQFAEYNRQDTADLNRGIEAVREVKQEINLANTRSSSPRMGW